MWSVPVVAPTQTNRSVAHPALAVNVACLTTITIHKSMLYVLRYHVQVQEPGAATCKSMAEGTNQKAHVALPSVPCCYGLLRALIAFQTKKNACLISETAA